MHLAGVRVWGVGGKCRCIGNEGQVWDGGDGWGRVDFGDVVVRLFDGYSLFWLGLVAEACGGIIWSHSLLALVYKFKGFRLK